MADKPNNSGQKSEKRGKKGYHVFISHASEDTDLARQLRDALTARDVKCWFDEERLEPGENWSRKIRDAIDRSQICLLMLSRASEASEPWISQEWSFIQSSAWKRNDLTLLPVLFDRVEPPTFLRDWQALRCYRRTADINQLATEIVERLSPGRITPEEKPEEKSQAKTVERFRKIIQTLAKATSNEHTQKEKDTDE